MDKNRIFDEQVIRLLSQFGVTEFDSVLEEAVAEATVICAKANEEFDMEDWERWELSQDDRKLVLSSDQGSKRLSFNIQVVGTFSHETMSWKWSWDNPNIDNELSTDATTVKEFGGKHSFDQLCDGQWQGSVEDGWLMSALTLRLCGGVGLYSGDFGNGRIFVVLKSHHLFEQQ